MTGLAVVKHKQQIAWGSGDYAAVGSRLLITSEQLCESIDLRAGERVLDVACGSGNASLAAARRFCSVVGVDYVSSLLETARRRAAAEGLDASFENGDAEALPFPDESFDVVLSACGAMFAPDQVRTASELLRVVRPGGRVWTVNWAPDSYIGELFGIIARYVPPAPGVRPPVLWGDEKHLRALFGEDVQITAPRRTLRWRWPSAEHQVDYFTTFYGPTLKAVEAAGEERGGDLKAEMVEAAQRFNLADDGTLVLAMDYLEPIITKRP